MGSQEMALHLHLIYEIDHCTAFGPCSTRPRHNSIQFVSMWRADIETKRRDR